jgi:hypothetical protein
MCKAAGFADHAHKNWPCTKCNVTRETLYSDLSLANGTYLNEFQRYLTGFIGFTPRNGEEFRQKSYEYRSLDGEDARKRFFDAHGVRWTEFARLNYFDVVRCSVIDPMHNLLQGVVKNQWFSRWIKKSSLRPATDRRRRELSAIHDFMDSVSCLTSFELIIYSLLDQFESPLWAGTLPARVGETSGGSLTSDEYKFAATTPWPIIVCTFFIAFIY